VYPKEVDLLCNWSLKTFLLNLASKKTLDRQNQKTFGFAERGRSGEGLQWYVGTADTPDYLLVLRGFEFKQRRKKKPAAVSHQNKPVKHSGGVFRFFLGTMPTPGCKKTDSGVGPTTRSRPPGPTRQRKIEIFRI
jgi:hypothetical protein